MERPAWPAEWSTTYVDETQAVIDDLQAAADSAFSLPDQSGNAGRVLATDGTDAVWRNTVAPSYLPRPGLYYDQRTALLGTNNAPGAVTADRLYFVPFVCPPSGFGADAIAIKITNNGAGTGRLGVFDAHPSTGLPYQLVIDAGGVDCSTTGSKVREFDPELFAGSPDNNLVWLAGVFSGTPTVDCQAAPGHIYLGWQFNAGGATDVGCYMSHTYGALPSSASSLTMARYTAPFVPGIALRTD